MIIIPGPTRYVPTCPTCGLPIHRSGPMPRLEALGMLVSPIIGAAAAWIYLPDFIPGYGLQGDLVFRILGTAMGACFGGIALLLLIGVWSLLKSIFRRSDEP